MKVEIVDNKMLMTQSPIINLLTTVLSVFQRVPSTLMLRRRVIMNTGIVKYNKLNSKSQLTISVFSIVTTAWLTVFPPTLNSAE